MKVFNRYILNDLEKYLDFIKEKAYSEKVKNLLLNTLYNNKSEKLTSEDIEELMNFLSNLFMKYGLKEDSEPNELGLLLDAMVGELNRVDRQRNNPAD